ncbi:MAG: anti-sigma factor [Thermoleophilaceae bacterium]|nr:anti-sigma factor [Thermoleophilaceae bacterium]
MPTLDSLSDERRAIIELVIRRGKTYAEISDLLTLPEDRVRAYARESLTELAPRTAERVETSWRGQVADYLLRQQSGPEALATRGHLKSSDAARTWALSLADSLADLYPDDAQPDIPEATAPQPVAGAKPRVPSLARHAAGPLSPGTASMVVRRRIIGAVAATVAIALVAFGLGKIFGGDPPPPVAGTETETETAPEVIPIGAVELAPLEGEQGVGLVTLFSQGGQPGIVIEADALEPTDDEQAYQVWLYNSDKDAVGIGAAQTDPQGRFAATGALPTDFVDYKFIDVSREPIDEDDGHSGESVLRAKVAEVQSAEELSGGAGGGGAPPAEGAAPPAPEAPAPPTP